MGNEKSSMAVQPTDLPYLCVFLRQPDLVRVVGGISLSDLIRQIITKDGFCIDEEVDYCGSHTFKLKGRPFSSSGKLEAIATRRMLCNVLSTLSSNGITLVASSNLSRRLDLTSWIFRRENIERPSLQVVSVCLNSSDSLVLVNCENEPKLDQMVTLAIKEKYQPGLQARTEESQTPVYKLKGSPWSSEGSDRIQGMWLLLEIISKFQSIGYVYLGRIDLMAEADSLFFSKIKPTNQIEAYPLAEPHLFSLSLEKKDSIRLIGAPVSVVTAIRGVILQHYPKSIQCDEAVTGEKDVWDFKLSGNPWWPHGAVDEISSRYLILKLFEMLHSTGWHVKVTMDTSKSMGDKSVFVIESCRPEPMQFVCLSLNSTDIIRLINADTDLVNDVGQIIKSNWQAGVKSEKETQGPFKEIVPEWKLKGFPWGALATDGIVSRALMCALLAMFERNDWTLASSADVSAKFHQQKNNRFPLDVDSWFLAKPIGGTAPVAAGV